MTTSNAHHESHLHMLQRQLIILERKKELSDLLEMNKLKDEIAKEEAQLVRARELHLTGYDEEVL